MNLNRVSRSRNIIKKTSILYKCIYFIYISIFIIIIFIIYNLLIFVVTKTMKNISVIIDNTTFWIYILRCN